jgi:peptide/nickel transport system permease protein
MAVRDTLPAPLAPSTLGTIARRIVRLPFAVSLATLWLALMVVVALGADFLLPYSITAFDLKASRCRCWPSSATACRCSSA